MIVWLSSRRRSLRQSIWLLYLLIYPLPWLVDKPSHVDIGISLVGIAVFLGLFFWHPTGNRQRTVQVVATVAIGYILSPHRGAWTVFDSFAAGFTAWIPNRTLARIILGIQLASLIILGPILHYPWVDTAFAVLLTGMTALASSFNVSLVARNRQLLEAQSEVRSLAATAERERIARDLHDLLGHSLTMIALKADLAGRMIARDPGGAARDIAEIAAAARIGLREVRAAVTGMKGASLAYEIGRAREALRSAGVTLDVIGAVEPIPPSRDGVLAMALREAVTNVIRHTQATHCTLTLTHERGEVAAMTVQDNGEIAGLPEEGNGLRGMRARLAAAGGALDITAGNPGLRLTARMSAA